MMCGAKLDVMWSPVHHDKFILWGSDITLYEVAPLKDIEKKSTCVKISPSCGATVVASQSGGGVRCLDASTMAGQTDPLLALGHTSGRVSLVNLGQNSDTLGLGGKEFVPLYSRLCNSVSWSPVETNLLAAAMDKYRNDHCVLVWDVNRGLGTDTDTSDSLDTNSSEQPRPLAEMGLSETAHSVSWANDSNRILLASMNTRNIKIFDLRDLSNKAVLSATSRQCYGVCADPFSPWQLASRGECAVCVWDTRALERPLLVLPQARPVAKLQWCPTRRNLLASLGRDAAALRLHDVQQRCADAPPAAAVERDACAGAAPLAGFGWHPQQPARVLAVALSGALLDHAVCERVALAWGARAGLAWAGGAQALRLMPDAFHTQLHDISYIMKKRAQTDYGLKPDLWQNADLTEDESLKNLWHFLALSRSLVEDGCIRNSALKHPGVQTVIGGEGAGYRSEAVTSLFPDMPNRRVTIYRSAERQRALQLCGWGWGWEQAGAGVERAEAEGQPARAAALAAFHLRLRAALEVLARAADPALRVAGLALAGLGEERLWRDALPAAAAALPDPYMRALLHFLAAAAPSAAPLERVLDETGVRLEDRVAFACIYLPDARLREYLAALAERLRAEGDLAGVLLTGASAAGVELLQRWLDASGDVQSAALVAARCLPAELLAGAAAGWLEEYRALLDGWKLWRARCALDTWAAGSGAGAEARGVLVACGYCGKSVAAAGGVRRARVAPPAAKMKQLSSCGHCRKPLPRCAVCSLHLGTAAGAAGAGGGASFAGWFTWCVACRHGGHAAHLIQWFKEHSECPVSSCACRCSALDPPDTLDAL